MKKKKKYLEEKARLAGVLDKIILTGFIPEENLVEYFKTADIYVMPSVKEGFGIVFVEAMYYGLPVIAGNKDGSVDALLNGELGILVDPLNHRQLLDAISEVIEDKDEYTPNKLNLMDHFGYDVYKRNLGEVLWN